MGLKAVGAFFPRLYSRFIFSKFTNRTCATRTCLRSPPAGGSPRTPRRRLSFALGRRAVATGVPDDLPAVPESAAAAAAAPMGTPGNVPVGANDGAVAALPVRRRPDRRRPEDLSCGAKGMLDGAAVVAALSGAVNGL